MSTRNGPPKHQNRFAWIPNAGHKKNETELGGKLRPYSEVTGVCPRCKDQIEWKRRYGKYKPLVEPAKCQKCTKRVVRQAYHSLCSGCAKDLKVCAKCCCSRHQIVGRDGAEVEAEQKALAEAIKNARERDRRTLLRAVSWQHFVETNNYGYICTLGQDSRACNHSHVITNSCLLIAMFESISFFFLMNKGKAGSSTKAVKIGDRSREGDLFHATTIDEYAQVANQNDSDEDEDDDFICS